MTAAPAAPAGAPAAQPRVLLVTTDSIAPGPSGSGNRAIRWGLLEGLRSAGAHVGFFAARIPQRHEPEFVQAGQELALGPGCFAFRCGDTIDAGALAAFLAVFRPDVVLAYGTEPLRLVRAAGFGGPTGIMSIDLEFVPSLHRLLYNLRFGRPKQKLKSALLSPKTLLDALRIYQDVRRGYPLADFVINHAAHHADWHTRAHGLPVLYTPNPLAEIAPAPVRRPAARPHFALVGGIGGIATLTGLAWFAREVYPLLEPDIRAGRFEIHLIGKGCLDPALDRMTPLLVRRGFVEDLTREFETMTAMLVPTPITLGFRTRIIDAFRHGLPVIAHTANGAGFPELAHDLNAIVASTAAEFAAGLRDLAVEPARAERLGANAFAQFRKELSADHCAEKVLAFLKRGDR
jgi:glycosyltransferase involved in cell wall biosynthesis